MAAYVCRIVMERNSALIYTHKLQEYGEHVGSYFLYRHASI